MPLLPCWLGCSSMFSRRLKMVPSLPMKSARQSVSVQHDYDCCVRLGCGRSIDRAGRTFLNTPEANQYLVKSNPSYMGSMRELFAHRWTNLYPHTAESIRRAVPQAKVDFSNSPQEEVEAFLRRINRNTVAAAHALLKQFDFSSTRTLADVGCGGAGLALTMTKRCPHIRATAIDLPLVVPIAQKIVAEEGARDRVQVLAADLLSGPLPGSYDVVILRGVLQCLAAEEARLAVRNIAAAVNSGGTIYIVAQILDDSRLSPLEALGYNLIFLNTFDAGQSYTEQEHRAWLSEAGFWISSGRNSCCLTGTVSLRRASPTKNTEERCSKSGKRTK